MADPLISAFANARRRERARIAGALHDDVAGGLTAAGLSLDLLSMDVPPSLAPRVAEIQAQLELSFESVRELARECHPDPAVRFHLAPALASLGRRFERAFAGEFEIALHEAPEEPAEAKARACFAIAEAALDNVLRHACARRAWLSWDGLALVVGDDGRGFKRESVEPGSGFAFMEYHYMEADMELSVQTAPGGGTRIEVKHKN